MLRNIHSLIHRGPTSSLRNNLSTTYNQDPDIQKQIDNLMALEVKIDLKGSWWRVTLNEESVWQVSPEWTDRGGFRGGRSSEYRTKLCFCTHKPRKSAILMGFEKKRNEIKIKGYLTVGTILLTLTAVPQRPKGIMWESLPYFPR